MTASPTGAPGEGIIDPREFRNALGRFASGVTVITTRHGDQTHGMTANAFVSVSLNPPLVLVSVDNRATLHRLLPLTRRYGVSVLAEDQAALSNHFAGRAVHPGAGRPTEEAALSFIIRHDMPVLEGAVAHIVVRLVAAHPAGDHTLYVGEVEYLDWQDARPLLFYAGKYQQLSVGPPRPAPWPEDEFSLFSIGNF
jgi:flavin reductase (DIM6/NTAB) family NADH-FMN oxidoreductase RutF